MSKSPQAFIDGWYRQGLHEAKHGNEIALPEQSMMGAVGDLEEAKAAYMKGYEAGKVERVVPVG